MGNKMRQFGLVIFGAIAGIMLSLNFSAVANKETQEVLRPLPVEELRAFTEVFGRIKSDYVEPVEDKKLITEAINGMLTGLDPHSAYLDADAFKELQIGTQGEFGGLGIEISVKDGILTRPNGEKIVYNASDHTIREELKGVAVPELLAFLEAKGLFYKEATGSGLLLHLLEAVPSTGNVGYTAIAHDAAEAAELEKRLNAALDEFIAGRRG